MNLPIKALLTLILIINSLLSQANDGAFRASGNQLIPMYETQVSVAKEILTIRRINPTQARIEVYYEFFNPGDAKEIETGFEAYSPSGDVNSSPVDGHQPYISQFTVTLNGQNTPYKVAIVKDSLYYRNGKYKALTVAQAEKGNEDNGDGVDFFYVYHFRSLFKHGLNIIRHTYIVDLSNSIIERYNLDYVLTAAKRWANRQIDDFTLQIDMGEFQDICVQNTFFDNVSEWKCDGVCKILELKKGSDKDDHNDTAEFFVRKGMIVFAKKNFKPMGELNIQSFSSYYYRVPDMDDSDGSAKPNQFDSKRNNMPFSIDNEDDIPPPADELSKKILRNLPFARRGYMFKSVDLSSYYENQKWYMQDPDYKPVVTDLTHKEQNWLKTVLIPSSNSSPGSPKLP